MEENPARFELLGHFRLVKQREIHDFPPGLPSALLAILLLHPGRVFAREELLEILWPDEDPQATRSRLRQLLYIVRHQFEEHGLEDPPLVTTTLTVQLRQESVVTDVAELESCFRQVAAGVQVADLSLMISRIKSLYAGQLLPGFYSEVVLSRRVALERELADALLTLSHASEAAAQWECCAEAARRLIELDPLNEEAHRALIRACSALHRPGDAIRQYRELEQVLRQELGVKPDAETTSLIHGLHIRPDSPVTPPTPVEAAPKSRPPTVPHTRRRSFPLVRAAAVVVFLALFWIAAARWRSQQQPPNSRPPAAMPAPGGEPLWVHRQSPIPGDKGSEGTCIAVDDSGSAYVAGFVDTESHDTEILVKKLSSAGEVVWEYRYNGPGNDVDRARSIAVDRKGYVYVAGDSDNGEGNHKRRLSGEDFVTLKLEPDGRPSPTWPDIGWGVGVRRYNGPADDEDRPLKLLVDEVGGVYVMGYSYGASGDKDYAVVKYSAEGKQVWESRYDSPDHDDDTPSDMCLTPDGGVCVTGSSRLHPKDSPETDVLTIKYRCSDGSPAWTQRWGHGNHADDTGKVIQADRWSILVSGEGRTSPGTYNNGKSGYVSLTYDPSGKLLNSRGASTDADQLDRVDTAWQGGAAGVTDGWLKVVFRRQGGSASEYRFHESGAEGSIVAYLFGAAPYVVGNVIAEPHQLDIFVLAINSGGQPVRLCSYRGLDDNYRYSIARAACLWNRGPDIYHRRDTVYVTGQSARPGGRDLVVLCYRGISTPPGF